MKISVYSRISPLKGNQDFFGRGGWPLKVYDNGPSSQILCDDMVFHLSQPRVLNFVITIEILNIICSEIESVSNSGWSAESKWVTHKFKRWVWDFGKFPSPSNSSRITDENCISICSTEWGSYWELEQQSRLAKLCLSALVHLASWLIDLFKYNLRFIY